MPSPSLESWLDTPQGRYVLSWVKAHCAQEVADVFGFHALQVGLPEHNLLAANRIPLQIHLGEAKHPNTQLRANPAELPIDSQSLDLLILPFVLDFHEDPHLMLREVERVLRPEGQLLLIGFNPWSAWGLWRGIQRMLFRLFQHPLDFPWQGHFLSIPRIRDWLKLLAFEVDRGAFGAYIPPCHSEKAFRRLRWVDLAGNRWWGFSGGVYLLRAVKRVNGIRLITPWARKTSRSALLSTTPARNALPKEQASTHV